MMGVKSYDDEFMHAMNNIKKVVMKGYKNPVDQLWYIPVPKITIQENKY